MSPIRIGYFFCNALKLMQCHSSNYLVTKMESNKNYGIVNIEENLLRGEENAKVCSFQIQYITGSVPAFNRHRNSLERNSLKIYCFSKKIFSVWCDHAVDIPRVDLACNVVSMTLNVLSATLYEFYASMIRRKFMRDLANFYIIFIAC